MPRASTKKTTDPAAPSPAARGNGTPKPRARRTKAADPAAKPAPKAPARRAAARPKAPDLAVVEQVARQAEALQRQYADAGQHLEDVGRQTAIVRQQLDAVRAEADATHRELDDIRQQARAALERLAAVVPDAQRQLDLIAAATGQARQEMAAVQQQSAEAEQRLAAIRAEAAQAELNLAAVRDEFREAERRLTAIRRDLQDVATDVQDTRAQIAQVAATAAQSPEERNRLGLSVAPGVVIAEVLPGTPADAAGAAAGDVVQTLNGAPVSSGLELRDMVQEFPDGSAVELEVLRDGTPLRLSATLQAPPADAPPESRNRLGLTVAPGVVVAGVLEGLPADAAGIVAGDVVLGINGAPVVSGEQLRAAVQSLAGRAEVRLDVARGGEVREVPLRLDELLPEP